MEPELTPQGGGGRGLTTDGLCSKDLGISVYCPQSLLPSDTQGLRRPQGLFLELCTSQSSTPRGRHPPCCSGKAALLGEVPLECRSPSLKLLPTCPYEALSPWLSVTSALRHARPSKCHIGLVSHESGFRSKQEAT